ncbi:MAG: gfo/Idh/MocA family oxidoreductase [Candidatus Mycalebacterium zealandia]|nr:MAG: gfo/Idh/MocA family oxidoreductase [Candidatus Mycalebacterium zealandia]
MNIAVAGYGYWGPNLARNFASLDGVTLKAICDEDSSLLEKARKNHPLISTTEDFEDITSDESIDAVWSIDAVCLATPALTHAELGLHALKAGKHVLVEKPMATTSADCEKMTNEAEKRGLVLMVDHVFAYSGAVRKLAALASEKSLGELYYFDSTRINLGIVRSDVNVLWDLAIHDLSILFQVNPAEPVAVSASGVSHIKGKPIDTAYLTLHYDSFFIAHVHVSWLAPVKIRRTTVAGDKKMAIYDDTEQAEKLKIYDSGINTKSASSEDIKKLLIEYRTGDINSPKLDSSEPLFLAAKEFYDCVREKKEPLTGAYAGAQIARVLEAADTSIKQNGQRIDLSR